MKHLVLLASSLGLFAHTSYAQTGPIRQYRQQHEHQLLTTYLAFTSIPNVVTDSANIRRNADYILTLMQQMGVRGQLLEGKVPSTAPAVFGEVNTPGATRTIVFYAHYDGQPVNPANWAEGTSPFRPTFFDKAIPQGGKPVPTPKPGEKIDPNWRLYGRSTSDDKAGVFAILTAYDAIRQSKLTPGVNIKFFFEGEEEAGSVHLADILEKHRSKLAADTWIIGDGPVHPSGRKQVVFGCRGDVNLNLTVYGPKRPLHSGHYGNYIPNPAMKLVQLLASMKDTDGRILVKGFNDDVIPLTAAEKKAFADMPTVEPGLSQELGIAKPDGAGASLMEQISLPSLNINGLQSANVGAMSANVIPTVANAVLDLRLVPGNDVGRQIQKVKDHAKAQGFVVIDHEPTDAERLASPSLVRIVARGGGYNAQRTSMDAPLSQAVIRAVQGTTEQPVVVVPMTGGSLPLFIFEQTLGAKPITLGIPNADNNQHAENENLRLQTLWDGIETFASVMLMR